MHKTLSCLLLAAMLPLSVLPAVAAPGNPDCPLMDGDGGHYGRMHGERAGHGAHGAHGLAALQLSDEQHAAVRKAMRDYLQAERDRVQAYLERLPAAEKAAMQKDAEASRAARDQAIRSVLTPEQLKQYQSLQDDMEKRRAERAEFEAWKAQRESKGN